MKRKHLKPTGWYIVKRFAKTPLNIALLLIMAAACNRASTQPPSYGGKVHYAQGQPLNFPDVTMEFVGKREAPASVDYPRGMTFYDFKVYQGNQAQLVSWSAGAGDIGPTLFELAGNRYALELAMSDQLGSLGQDELVLWREVSPTAEPPTSTPAPTPILPTPTSLPPVTITLGQPFSLALNQYGRLDSTGLGVEFYELVEDTRCPRQVVCESAGWASLGIYVWKTNIEPIELILNTDPTDNQNVVSYDEYQVRLLSLDPYPETVEPKIPPRVYVATFIVSKK
ncbi:MAG: hypothetical protein KDJ97_36760 [Anaerolineae bacterium]|nr:hypothetical protein [Anaerolineae bacterium]